MTVAALLQEKILTIGENIKIRRFDRKEGVVVTYNHGGGRMSVLASFEAPAAVASKPEFTEYAKISRCRLLPSRRTTFARGSPRRRGGA